MAEDEDIDVPISALEHYSYCPRQCGLIHIEQTFEENIFTIKGRIAHERVDAADAGIARGVRVLRGVSLWSERYGLRGKADVVEMRAEGPYPVEYKVGRRRGRPVWQWTSPGRITVTLAPFLAVRPGEPNLRGLQREPLHPAFGSGED